MYIMSMNNAIAVNSILFILTHNPLTVNFPILPPKKLIPQTQNSRLSYFTTNGKYTRTPPTCNPKLTVLLMLPLLAVTGIV